MKTRREGLKQDVNRAAEWYFDRITDLSGQDADKQQRALEAFGKAALKLHLFDQGFSAAKRAP